MTQKMLKTLAGTCKFWARVSSHWLMGYRTGLKVDGDQQLSAPTSHGKAS